MVTVYEKSFIEVSHTIGTVVYYKVNTVKIEVLDDDEIFGYDKFEVNDDYNLLSPIDVGGAIRTMEKPITFNEKVRHLEKHTWLGTIKDIHYGVVC